ncbi:hypothetical protein D5086_000541 [Populus alba]|uniref:Uncharacterized protein n=1 Tax=Populus alba TaxID=43335 RepID=A0ACC4CW75_POPAL
MVPGVKGYIDAEKQKVYAKGLVQGSAILHQDNIQSIAPSFSVPVLASSIFLPISVTEWSAGLYVSLTIAGSRPGDLIPGAWASFMIKEIPELFIIGRPDVTIVAIRSNDLDIFEVNDIMISNMLASECIAETQQGCSCWLFGGGGEGSSVMASSV